MPRRDDDNRRHNQPKEETPDEHRLIDQHPFDARREEKDGTDDAYTQHDKEKSVGQTHGDAPLAAQQGPPENRLSHHADAADQFLVDAQNKGNRPAGDARHHVGTAHGKAGEKDAGVIGRFCSSASPLRHIVDCHFRIVLHIEFSRPLRYPSGANLAKAMTVRDTEIERFTQRQRHNPADACRPYEPRATRSRQRQR